MAAAAEFDINDIKRRMDGALAALKAEFAGLRTGRATASLLEPIHVDAYGASTPLNQVGSISAPEPRMLVVQVWDRGLSAAVDKAIRAAGLGLNPVSEGQTIRVPIPPLNQERRTELARTAGKYAEAARVAIRNVRRDGMDQIKKAKSAGMSEDDQKLWTAEVQDLTDKAIAGVDRALETKQAEIMQV
jgi:ribosome recycling factor